MVHDAQGTFPTVRTHFRRSESGCCEWPEQRHTGYTRPFSILFLAQRCSGLWGSVSAPHTVRDAAHMDDVASTDGAAWGVDLMLSLPEQSAVTFEVPISSRFYDIPSATAKKHAQFDCLAG
ncbi:hypothetical protein CDEST_03536 [Colletotrichum destructivum]|uniref:Uncharacterized protein n=1 Tax=Colletotrichum destructivum TaxID=34406 RepID=A0AAX4I564_9PEZI|nr:hypothetical protein CDEST_03536 [Colletotrichum destructivum]